MLNRFRVSVVVLLAMFFVTGCKADVNSHSDSGPVKFGVGDLQKALVEVKAEQVQIDVFIGSDDEAKKRLLEFGVKLPDKGESFIVFRNDGGINIIGTDEVGAMYGCLELAERIKLNGKEAFSIEKPIVQTPALEFRGVNPFFVLPYKGEKFDESWWFLSEDFWDGYIKQLARARINFIDLHGAYDIRTATMPSMFPYLIKSDKFPDVGLSKEQTDRNLAMLNKVIKMAKNHGVKFGVMNYSTYEGPGCPRNLYMWNEENKIAYTREVVCKLLQSCPDLAMFGFRIGEYGTGEDFFKKTYVAAIRESGRDDIEVYTRSWRANKSTVLGIAEDFPDNLYVEIKYNGELYGPAHIVAGGKMAGWGTYSYTDYINYPRPYKPIYQVRVNGTHRIFPWGSPDFVARTTKNSLLMSGMGISVEPINAYYPADDYVHQDGSSLGWYKWMYQRDWFFYEVWGRMTYNPEINEELWVKRFEKRFGKDIGKDFYNAFTTASLIVPYAQTFFCLSPDHRGHAPENETGGYVTNWSDIGPFDDQIAQSAKEYIESILNNKPSARLNPLQQADMLEDICDKAMASLDKAKKAGSKSEEFNSLSVDIEMLNHLGRYYAQRLRCAAYFALYRASYDQFAAEKAQEHFVMAIDNWRSLAKLGDEHFKPIPETLRMLYENFTWSKEAARTRSDNSRLERQLYPLYDLMNSKVQPKGLAVDILEAKGDKTGPVVEVQKFSVNPISPDLKRLEVFVSAEDPSGVKKLYLKHKTFPSESHWQFIEMEKTADKWVGTLDVKNIGALWCIEAFDNDDNGTMWPDFRVDIPYRVVNPWKVDKQ